MSSSPNLSDVKSALDSHARKFNYSCKDVSWEDVQRGTNANGSLSSIGPNISDVRLFEKTGKLLYTLRSCNFNEKLGRVAASDVAVVVGNHVPNSTNLESKTLAEVLANVGVYGKYVGLETASLANAELDAKVSIRFQTVFLPVEDTSLAKAEFCTEVFNYFARDDDPRNLLLLTTAQGLSVQADGSGGQRLPYHLPTGKGSEVLRYWFEAERSIDHKVGGAQAEVSDEAAQEAAARGKSTSRIIGTKAMGSRMNVHMMVQIPVKQRPQPQRSYAQLECFESMECLVENSTVLYDMDEGCVKEKAPAKSKFNSFFSSLGSFGSRKPAAAAAPVGTSNAARVSRGSEYDRDWKGLGRKDLVRDDSQHVTITTTIFYVVAGGVPSRQDVERAITDLELLYAQCDVSQKLSQATDITAPLTAATVAQVQQKPAYQPPVFTPAAAGSAFPEAPTPAVAAVSCSNSFSMTLE